MTKIDEIRKLKGEHPKWGAKRLGNAMNMKPNTVKTYLKRIRKNNKKGDIGGDIKGDIIEGVKNINQVQTNRKHLTSLPPSLPKQIDEYLTKIGIKVGEPESDDVIENLSTLEGIRCYQKDLKDEAIKWFKVALYAKQNRLRQPVVDARTVNVNVIQDEWRDHIMMILHDFLEKEDLERFARRMDEISK